MPILSKKTTALIRHEALNIITTLRFLVEANEPLDELTKTDVLDSMAWASILLGHPEVFDQKPLPLFLETTSLNELLELSIVLQSQKDQLKICNKVDEFKGQVKTDKNRAKDLLAALFRFALQQAPKLELQFRGNKLLIQHGQPTLPLPQSSVLDCLMGAKMTYFERFLCVLLSQSSSIGLKILNKKGILEVHFKFQQLYDTKNT